MLNKLLLQRTKAVNGFIVQGGFDRVRITSGRLFTQAVYELQALVLERNRSRPTTTAAAATSSWSASHPSHPSRVMFSNVHSLRAPGPNAVPSNGSRLYLEVHCGTAPSWLEARDTVGLLTDQLEAVGVVSEVLVVTSSE